MSPPPTSHNSVREACSFFADSLPIAIVDFIKLLMPALTTMRVGHNGATATDLAGASVGILAFNVAGNMISTAPLAAMDTIAPQAFGAGNKPGVGLAFQRAIILAIVFLLPTAPLWIYAEAILAALGQPPDVARFGAQYMRLLLPGLLPFAIFEAARKFVYAQGLRTPPVFSACLGLAALFVWLEVWCALLGVRAGAPVALSCTYATLAAALLAHIRSGWRMPAAMACWPRGVHRQLLWTDRVAWRHMIVTSLSALVSLSEWLFWEVNCFRVGQMGTIPLATYSIAYAIEPVCFMLPLGLSTGLSNSVGNQLGARRPNDARRLARVGLAVGYATVVVVVALVFAGGGMLARLFSTDPEVLLAAEDMWKWFCMFMLISGPFALLLGLNRGLGLQRATAACVIGLRTCRRPLPCLSLASLSRPANTRTRIHVCVSIAVWPLGAPLVCFWAQSPSNVWQALTITYSVLTLAMATCAGCSNWDVLAERASAKSNGGEAEMQSVGGGLAAADSAKTATSTSIEQRT